MATNGLLPAKNGVFGLKMRKYAKKDWMTPVQKDNRTLGKGLLGVI
jgi:hypothetical protein